MELLSAHSQQLRPPSISSPSEPPAPSSDLVAALERATQAAKQLPSSTDPSHLRSAFASLHAAHHHLAAFLARFHPQPSPAENSVDSVDEHMADRLLDDHDDGSEGVNSEFIEKVEEGIRDCAIHNKRKRPLSPTWVPENSVHERVREFNYFDPSERMRSLDLIFQFHA
ncbi:hypothetical protein H6P81_008319 [Aristolochia fimbriata]|uniref:Uncharacterized protein n=1 Tax=Aristolochia fimbriata TaxID=158543 RepID=A0AAV7F2P4_ARIFI|nr:hypothetical protein H6P81_008319 [Aristolochia fimbriata]